MRFERGFNQGFSLIEVLVAAALVGMLAAAMAGMYSYSFKTQGALTSKNDKEQIRQLFTRSVNCTDTMPGGTCAPNSMVVVRNGTNILATNSTIPTKYGIWSVRARCAPGGNGLIMSAVRLKSTGTITSTSPSDFEPDPVTKQPITWDDPRSLLAPAGILVCASSTLENRVAVLETTATTQGGQIATLQAQVATLQGQVATLIGQVGSLTNFVNNMKNNLCTSTPKRPLGGFDVSTGVQQCGPVASDYNGDGYPDFATGAWSGTRPTVGSGPAGPFNFLGGAPHVKIYSGAGANSGAAVELNSFYAYAPGFQGGVSVSLVDVTGDGLADIVSGAGPGGGSHVNVFRAPIVPAGAGANAGAPSFFAYPGYVGGIMVGP